MKMGCRSTSIPGPSTLGAVPLQGIDTIPYRSNRHFLEGAGTDV